MPNLPQYPPAPGGPTTPSGSEETALGLRINLTAVAIIPEGVNFIPTGTMVFIAKNPTNPLENTTLGVAVLDDTGTARLTLSSSTFGIGNFEFIAYYSGDDNFAPGISAPFIEIITPPGTITTLQSSLNPSQLGESVTFTASVHSTNPPPDNPTGFVSFYDGATFLGASSVVSNTASFSTSLLPGGPNLITAVYSGDANYRTSTSSPLTQTVVQLPIINVAVSPSSFNDLYIGNLTFTATFPQSPTPTGTVNFWYGEVARRGGWPGDAIEIATGVPIVSGVATYTVSNSILGIHTDAFYNASCDYSGDTNYMAEPFTYPTPFEFGVVPPFNILTSLTNGNTETGNTLTDTTVDFSAGGEYSVQVNDQVIMTSTGNVYQVLSVPSSTSLTVQQIITPAGNPGLTSWYSSDVGTNVSYYIQSYNIAPSQYWPIASGAGQKFLTTTVLSGMDSAPTPTGHMTFYYYQSSGPWTQLGTISSISSSGGLLEVSTNTEHGLVSGQSVFLSGVTGYPTANGQWTVQTVPDSLDFTINLSYSGALVSTPGSTAIVLSSGAAVYNMNASGSSPWGSGRSGETFVAAVYSGDSNYNPSSAPSGNPTTPPGAPGVYLVSAG